MSSGRDGTEEAPDQVRAWVEATCAAQGLAVGVTDSVVIGKVAALLGRGARTRTRRAPAAQARQTGSTRSGSRPRLPGVVAGRMTA